MEGLSLSPSLRYQDAHKHLLSIYSPMLFWKSASLTVLQSSDLEGSYNTDPGHGYGGSWFVFLSVCLFSKPVLDLNYVCATRLLVLLVGACPLLSPQGLAPLLVM